MPTHLQFAIQTARQALIDQGMPLAEVSTKIESMKAAGELPTYNYLIPILMLVALGVISIFLAFKLKQADQRQKAKVQQDERKRENLAGGGSAAPWAQRGAMGVPFHEEYMIP